MTARIRLRQVALVAADLEAAEAQIVEELGLSMCFRDPGVAEFGLRNALFPVGEQLLEVVSPTQADTTAGRFLDRRGGDGGYMAIFETDEPVDGIRRRMAELGVRIVFEAAVPGITGLHLHPRDVGGAIVSVDHTDVWGEWPWAGPTWRNHVRTDIVSAIAAVEIAADDPTATCHRWAEVLGRPAGDDARSVELDDDTEVRFVEITERGAGIDLVELRATDDPASRDANIAGCAFRLR